MSASGSPGQSSLSHLVTVIHDNNDAAVTSVSHPRSPPADETGFGPPQALPDHFPSPCESKSKSNLSSTSSSSSSSASRASAPVPLMTGAYHLTRLTLIHGDDLERGGRWDIRQWQPIFVKGVLELPATLAYVLGHEGVPSLCASMVGGKLVRSGEQGTVVLGRGKRNARELRAWYSEAYVCVMDTAEIGLADESSRRLAVVRWVQRKGWDGSGEVDLGNAGASESKGSKPNKDTGAAGTQLDLDKVIW